MRWEQKANTDVSELGFKQLHRTHPPRSSRLPQGSRHTLAVGPPPHTPRRGLHRGCGALAARPKPKMPPGGASVPGSTQSQPLRGPGPFILISLSDAGEGLKTRTLFAGFEFSARRKRGALQGQQPRGPPCTPIPPGLPAPSPRGHRC